jgi:hypothetical protein
MKKTLDNNKIKNILLEGNYVSKEDIKKAEEFAKINHITITDSLLAKGVITNDLLGQAIAEAYKVVYADLNSHQPAREQVLKIPEKTAKKLRAVFFSEDKNTITTIIKKRWKLVSPKLLKNSKGLPQKLLKRYLKTL